MNRSTLLAAALVAIPINLVAAATSLCAWLPRWLPGGGPLAPISLREIRAPKEI